MTEPTKRGATPNEGDGKRILIILGTPKSNSLCHALSDAYAHGARGEGHVVRLLRLGELSFDPVLHNGYDSSQQLEPDLIEAQRQIHWAEHLLVVYPVWWGGQPALLSGFFERVLTPGFAFKYRPDSLLWDELLDGRTADIMITLDTPSWHMPWKYGAPAHHQVTRAILNSCGIKPGRLTEFAPIRTASEEQRLDWLRKAENLGARV
ncbi:NAD(P)H-dependent oxidoreductase [Pseudomonas sp. RL_15y_Pfl2_60]|uniref:NAD(P)H-dependent oxidoreductase n=1 Tax=Pseudomonas sp. RL_15y_Pfl2_60 TaxID=3088709 RepID=UPI0030DC2EE7